MATCFYAHIHILISYTGFIQMAKKILKHKFLVFCNNMVLKIKDTGVLKSENSLEKSLVKLVAGENS